MDRVANRGGAGDEAKEDSREAPALSKREFVRFALPEPAALSSAQAPPMLSSGRGGRGSCLSLPTSRPRRSRGGARGSMPELGELLLGAWLGIAGLFGLSRQTRSWEPQKGSRLFCRPCPFFVTQGLQHQ